LDIQQFRFEDIEVDAATRQLTRAGLAVRIEPKVFDALVLLLRQKSGDTEKRERLFLITPRIVQSAATAMPPSMSPAVPPTTLPVVR
jgi:hypothetical protein